MVDVPWGVPLGSHSTTIFINNVYQVAMFIIKYFVVMFITNVYLVEMADVPSVPLWIAQDNRLSLLITYMYGFKHVTFNAHLSNKHTLMVFCLFT